MHGLMAHKMIIYIQTNYKDFHLMPILTRVTAANHLLLGILVKFMFWKAFDSTKIGHANECMMSH